MQQQVFDLVNTELYSARDANWAFTCAKFSQ